MTDEHFKEQLLFLLLNISRSLENMTNILQIAANDLEYPDDD